MRTWELKGQLENRRQVRPGKIAPHCSFVAVSPQNKCLYIPERQWDIIKNKIILLIYQ